MHVTTDDRIEIVRAMTNAWLPADEHGRASKKRCLDFLATNNSPFAREDGDEHITASAVVISSAGVLLHKHKRAGIWTGPGGHVDVGEMPWDAAVRETLEETGVTAWHPVIGPALVGIDTHPTSINHLHHDLRFVLLSEPDVPVPGVGESPEVGWFTDEVAHEMTEGAYSYSLVTACGLSLQRP